MTDWFFWFEDAVAHAHAEAASTQQPHRVTQAKSGVGWDVDLSPRAVLEPCS